MLSAAIALALLGGHLVVVFGVRELEQRRRWGRSSWVAPARKPPIERLADAVFVLAYALAFASPALVLAGVLAPALDGPLPVAGGAALVLGATALARRAQRDMGEAWRTGVADEPSSQLVVGGTFGRVRNPVYTALVGAATGAALAAPTAIAGLAVVVLVVGLQVQTRAVEEPHLRREHGEAYARYARRAGRFIPGIGRLGERRRARR